MIHYANKIFRVILILTGISPVCFSQTVFVSDSSDFTFQLPDGWKQDVASKEYFSFYDTSGNTRMRVNSIYEETAISAYEQLLKIDAVYSDLGYYSTGIDVESTTYSGEDMAQFNADEVSVGIFRNVNDTIFVNTIFVFRKENLYVILNYSYNPAFSDKTRNHFITLFDSFRILKN